MMRKDWTDVALALGIAVLAVPGVAFVAGVVVLLSRG